MSIPGLSSFVPLYVRVVPGTIGSHGLSIAATKFAGSIAGDGPGPLVPIGDDALGDAASLAIDVGDAAGALDGVGDGKLDGVPDAQPRTSTANVASAGTTVLFIRAPP